MSRFDRVVPTGLDHGTVTVVAEGGPVEVTTFRQEGAYSDARRPDRVAFTNDPLVDLDRRDLTINALAWDPMARELLDPHGGTLDLERRRLRAVGEPLERFREDALRPWRVARLAAVLGMEPDRELRHALARVRDPREGVRVEAVSWERVRDELNRLLAAERPSRGFDLLGEAGLLVHGLPELERCRGVGQNRYHAYDVYEHSLRTCDAAPAHKPRVRWAALLHDIGKPGTKVIRDGDATFYGHAELGADLADLLLARLRFPNDERRAIVHLVREHMFDAALRRWLRRVGTDAVADLFDLRIADVVGNGLREGFPAGLERMRQRIQQLLDAAHALHVRDLAVDGGDVMRELGLTEGPPVGEALGRLLDEVLEAPERNTRERLLDRLRAMRSPRA
jgi:tRNA nucleotidyltransferase (CCA-adding enzyme)